MNSTLCQTLPGIHPVYYILFLPIIKSKDIYRGAFFEFLTLNFLYITQDGFL